MSNAKPIAEMTLSDLASRVSAWHREQFPGLPRAPYGGFGYTAGTQKPPAMAVSTVRHGLQAEPLAQPAATFSTELLRSLALVEVATAGRTATFITIGQEPIYRVRWSSAGVEVES